MAQYARYPSGQDTNATIVSPIGQKVMASSVSVAIASDQSPIPITGSITATNPSVGVTDAATPADATLIGGSDGTDLRAVKVSATGIVSVDGSAVTQPITGTGVAGVPDVGVVTVQGISSGTPVAVSGSVANASIGVIGSTTPTSATLIGGNDPFSDLRPIKVSATGVVSVDGSASTQPVSGTVAVTQATGTNLHTVVDSGTITAVTAITNALPAGTNVIGHVIVDSAPTTAVTGTFFQATQPVSLASIPAVTTSAAIFQAEGSIAAASITGSYATVFTPSAATKILQMRNNTNVSISVSFDAGTTLNYVLDAGDSVSLDLLSNSLVMSTTAIQIKLTSGSATTGSFRVNGCH